MKKRKVAIYCIVASVVTLVAGAVALFVRRDISNVIVMVAIARLNGTCQDLNKYSSNSPAKPDDLTGKDLTLAALRDGASDLGPPNQAQLQVWTTLLSPEELTEVQKVWGDKMVTH